MPVKKAGILFGLPYLISVVLLPIIGLFSDFLGNRVKIVILSSLVLIGAFLTSLLMPSCNDCYYEMYTIVIFGIGYSMYVGTIYACIPFVVEERLVGSAFGITFTMINIALSISPSIIGYL